MAEALEAQVENSFPSLDAKTRARFRDEVLARSTVGVEVAITDDTYRDIANSPQLAAFVVAHEPAGTTEVAPNRLAGIGANQVRMPGLEIRDGIGLTLSIAEINSEIGMAAALEECDLGTSPGVDVLLANKLKRIGATPSQLERFLSVLDLERIPDVSKAIASGDVSMAQVIRMRGRPQAKRFRKWLHHQDAHDSRELERLYLEAVGRESEPWPFTSIRLAATAALGAIGGPVTGLLASAADSVFVDKWIEGYNPKLFFERLRALPLSDRDKGTSGPD